MKHVKLFEFFIYEENQTSDKIKKARGISLGYFNNGNWDYPRIESCKNPEDIAALISISVNPLNDDEAVAEACFIAMMRKDTQKVDPYFYDKVALNLPNFVDRGISTPKYIDPYSYVKSGIDTSKRYHKQPIDLSRKTCKSQIFPDYLKFYDDKY